MPKSAVESKNYLKGTLRKAGYKATPARLSVLSVMRRSRAPLSAQEVIERVGKSFDPATVYRTFKNLKESGIIRQIDLRHNHAHYEFAEAEDHHHLICTGCGKIEDSIGCEVEDTYRTIVRASKNFFEIRQHSLEFYGLCNSCKK